VDMLYIPAGYWHGALSLSRRLSLSIPISPHRVEIQEDRHWIQLK
jgi:ribosomal protein L16 Arg81 hydroxylase